MRSSTTRLATALIAGMFGLTGLPGAANAQPAGTCNPTWHLVAAPAVPPAYTSQGYTGGTVAAVSPNNVWFPGYVSANAIPSQSWMPQWNGHAITVAPRNPASTATSQTVSGASFDSATDGWVVGSQQARALLPDAPYSQPYSAHWHDGQWTTVALPPSPEVDRSLAQPTALAALSPTNAWSVGARNLPFARTSTGTVIEHWDGSTWSIVPDPASQMGGASLVGVKAISAGNIWAVGRQVAPDGNIVPLVEHFDGTPWQIVNVPSGSEQSAFYALNASGPNDIWAVGDQTVPGATGTFEPLVEHFDGSSWTVVSNLPATGSSKLNAVYAASPTDVWATEQVPAHTAVGLLHYDGTTWTQVPWPGIPEYGQLSWALGIAGSGPDDVWALGGVTNNPGSTLSNTELRIAHLTCGGS